MEVQNQRGETNASSPDVGCSVVGWFSVMSASVTLADETMPTRIAGELTKIDGKALTITVSDAAARRRRSSPATRRRSSPRRGRPDEVRGLAGRAAGSAYYNKATGAAAAVIIAKPRLRIAWRRAEAGPHRRELTKIDARRLPSTTRL